MTHSTKNCPRCLAALPPDAPGGMCPKCLLAVGLGEPSVLLTRDGRPAPVPPTPGELQSSFPELEILELVGRGGMGAVYKVRQKGLDRIVALKILFDDVARDPAFEERFLREAHALGRLTHEHIVAIHDSGSVGGRYFLLMEYVDGPNLRQVIRAGTLRPEDVLGIVTQICSALEYAHRLGVVHRDIKPENVLVTREGRIKIADFGLAKLVDGTARQGRLTGTSQAMGTPHYMAPEQIERPLEVDHRADIYSLGVVFYELLTGELPIGRFPLPSQRVQIDVRLDDVVVKTLEKEPERRYQSAFLLHNAVDGITSTPPPIPMAPVAAAAMKPKRRWLVPVIVVGCLLLAVLPALALLFVFWGFTPAVRRSTTALPGDEAVPPNVKSQTANGVAPTFTDLNSLLIPAQWQRARDVLLARSDGVWANYLALERAGTKLATKRKGEQLAVVVAMDSTAFRDNVDEMWRELGSALGDSAVEDLQRNRAMSGFVEALFPFGVEPSEVHARFESGEWRGLSGPDWPRTTLFSTPEVLQRLMTYQTELQAR